MTRKLSRHLNPIKANQDGSPQLLAQPDIIDTSLESHNAWVVSMLY